MNKTNGTQDRNPKYRVSKCLESIWISEHRKEKQKNTKNKKKKKKNKRKEYNFLALSRHFPLISHPDSESPNRSDARERKNGEKLASEQRVFLGNGENRSLSLLSLPAV